MKLVNNNFNTNNNNSEDYTQKINELSGGIDIILSQFKKIYVIVKMNPNDTEYEQQLENILSNLKQISSKLFSISNDIQSNTNDLNKQLFQLNTLISEEKNNKEMLESKLESINGQNNSATEMIDNYKYMYNVNYLRNWALLLSAFLCIITIKIVYKKQVV